MQVSRILLIVAGLATTIIVEPVLAQNALGSGNALDANPRLGSNGINGPGRDINAIIRQANAVVDGTASGGRQFRGFGGNRSGSTFRDSLGGDANFAFQRDAALSGLTTSRGRSSDLLAAQSALYTGNAVPQGFADDLLQQRFAAATSGASLGSLRSASQREWDKSRQPSVLGVITAKDDTRRPVTFQPLRGLSFNDRDQTDILPGSPLERPANFSLDSSRLAADASRVNATTDRRTDPDSSLRNPKDDPSRTGRNGNALNSGQISNRADEVDKRFAAAKAETARGDAAAAEAAGPAVSSGTKSGPDVEALPRTPGPNAANRSTSDTAIEKLRQDLYQTKKPRTTPKSDPSFPRPGDVQPKANPDGTPDRSGPIDRAGTRAASSAAERNATQVPPVGSPLLGENLSTIETLRKMAQGKPLASLSEKPRTDSDWYNIIMAHGQELVNKGKYFEAEEVYTRLLAAKEGDSMARMGRVHAQLGAGAYLTAGKGLVELYRDRPQLVPTRFEEAGIMPRTVAAAAAKQLELELDRSDSAIGSEAAVLLAYLGFQYNEAAWLTRGLSEAPKRADDLNRPVIELLGDVWKSPSKP